MLLLSGGGKILWMITGLFLLLSTLIITITEVALPAAMIFPALYCLYSEKVSIRWSPLVAVIPLVLGVLPSLRFGALIYGALLASSLIMLMFLRRGHLGLAVAIPSSLFFSLFIVAVISIAQHQDIGFDAVLSQWADQILDQVQTVYQGLLSAQDMEKFHMSRPVLQARIVSLFPSIVLTSTAMILWLNLQIVSGTFRNLMLRAWRSPDWIVAIFILASALTLVQHRIARTIGLNLLAAVVQVYFFQGMGIVACFMNEQKWPAVIRWPLYILILIQIYIMIIIAGLGLFDTWFDFRKRIRTAKGDEQ
jgi:hypothetical protein